MKLNTYQAKAAMFHTYKHPDYAFGNLCNEASEVMDKLTKFGREHELTINDVVKHAASNSDELKVELEKELGDVLWQLAACCTELDIPLERLAHGNLAKLTDRAKRNVLVGKGDNR